MQPHQRQTYWDLLRLHHSSRQWQILNSLSKARDWTCVFMDTSQICFHWAMTGIPIYILACVSVCAFGFFWLPSRHLQVLSLRLNPCCRSNLSNDARSLTCCATRELQEWLGFWSYPLHPRDPPSPQRPLLTPHFHPSPQEPPLSPNVHPSPPETPQMSSPHRDLRILWLTAQDLTSIFQDVEDGAP